MTRAAPAAAVTALSLVLGACGLVGSSVPAEWQLTSPPGEAAVLDVLVALGVPCNDFAGVRVEETEDAVTVLASVEVAGGECEDSFESTPFQVSLDRPLGERLLLGCVPPDAGDVVRVPGRADRDCRTVVDE